MPSDYSRVHRLLKIVTLVQAGGNWTPAALAKECEASQRSIFRDIECIEAAGIPIQFDRVAKKYTIAGDHYLPPTQLSFEEALAIMALAESISRDEQVPHLRAAHSAAQKVRSQLPATLRKHLEQSEGRVTIRLGATTTAPDATAGVFEAARFAITARRFLDAEYDAVATKPDATDDSGKAANPPTRFKLAPYELVFDQRAWYIIGHSSRRNAVRTYRLSRFTRLQVTDETFDLPKNWSLEKYRGLAWRMVKGDRRHIVTLIFAADFADTIAETQWHVTQQTEWLDDGTLKFTCEVDGLDEIVWWILSMGPECRVVGPPELAAKVQDLAARTAAQYTAEYAAQATAPQPTAPQPTVPQPTVPQPISPTGSPPRSGASAAKPAGSTARPAASPAKATPASKKA